MIRLLKSILFGILISKLAVAHGSELRAELLYLKPNVDDTHFVLTSFDNTFKGSVTPKGKRHQNRTAFSPGFTVGGSYTICPETSFLDLCGTFFNAHSSHSVSGDFLYDTNGFPGFGAQGSPLYKGATRSRNSYQFYAGDFTYNRILMCCLPDKLMFIVGLHGAYIQFKEHTTSLGTFTNNDGVNPLSNHLHRNSQFFGIGPEVGLDYRYLLPKLSCLCGTWDLRVKAVGALLCGNTRSDLRYVTLRTGPGGVGVRNGDVWRIISSANAHLGINYTLDRMTVQLGYEFMWYSPCVNQITGLDVFFAGDMIDVFNSFSLHGPYLRISCAF